MKTEETGVNNGIRHNRNYSKGNKAVFTLSKGTREPLNVFVLREHTAWAVNGDIGPDRLLSPLYLLPPVPSVSISSMAFLLQMGIAVDYLKNTEYQCNYFPGPKPLNNCEAG